jgi:hypothetical protein
MLCHRLRRLIGGDSRGTWAGTILHYRVFGPAEVLDRRLACEQCPVEGPTSVDRTRCLPFTLGLLRYQQGKVSAIY